MKKKKNAAMFLALCALSGCFYDSPQDPWTGGTFVMQVRFPKQALMIPEDTARIEVRMTGQGIPSVAVLSAQLTPEKTQATFTGVPSGPKKVVAKAFDGEGEVLAAGSSEVTIVAGATVATRIRLNMLTDDGRFQLILE
jgi:hypothetical protein